MRSDVSESDAHKFARRRPASRWTSTYRDRMTAIVGRTPPSRAMISWFSSISARFARQAQDWAAMIMSSLWQCVMSGGTAPHFAISNLFSSPSDKLLRPAQTSRRISTSSDASNLVKGSKPPSCTTFILFSVLTERPLNAAAAC